MGFLNCNIPICTKTHYYCYPYRIHMNPKFTIRDLPIDLVKIIYNYISKLLIRPCKCKNSECMNAHRINDFFPDSHKDCKCRTCVGFRNLIGYDIALNGFVTDRKCIII